MAFASITPTSARGASLIERLRATVSEFGAARARRAEYLRTKAELSAMSDRDLADIGISRHDIDAIASQHLTR